MVMRPPQQYPPTKPLLTTPVLVFHWTTDYTDLKPQHQTTKAQWPDETFDSYLPAHSQGSMTSHQFRSWYRGWFKGELRGMSDTPCHSRSWGPWARETGGPPQRKTRHWPCPEPPAPGDTPSGRQAGHSSRGHRGPLSPCLQRPCPPPGNAARPARGAAAKLPEEPLFCKCRSGHAGRNVLNSNQKNTQKQEANLRLQNLRRKKDRAHGGMVGAPLRAGSLSRSSAGGGGDRDLTKTRVVPLRVTAAHRGRKPQVLIPVDSRHGEQPREG